MSASSSGISPQVPGFKQLERFRSDRRHLPLHPLEKAVLTVVAVHLCFLPWALGTMHVWSQLTSLGFSVIGFVLALIPRTYSGDYALPLHPQLPTPHNQEPITHNQAVAYRLTAIPRLLRFPIFWIGLALLAYIAVQGLNPSWVWERSTSQWWLRRVNDIPWLPTSIDTPFERFNLWRQLIIYASAWLTVCTVWTGFTRRHALHFLLFVLVINAVVLAAVGFYQRFAGIDSYLFLMKWPVDATPFASFIYKNHASAYLAMLAGIALTLAAWEHEKGVRHMARSTPAFIWLLAVIALAFAVFFTYSRGAMLIMLGFLLVAGITYGLRRLFSATRSTTHPAVWLLLAGMLLAVVGFGASQLNSRKAVTTFTSLFEKQEYDFSVAQRLDAYQAGLSMLADHWARGLGAGGFRFLFPEYIKHYPASYRNGQLFWEHAHCDWMQFPIELGALGSGLLVLAGLWGLAAMKRLKIWRHPAILVLCLAALQTLAHACFDFPLQNPAIMVTWCTVVVLAIRWTELDEAR